MGFALCILGFPQASMQMQRLVHEIIRVINKLAVSQLMEISALEEHPQGDLITL